MAGINFSVIPVNSLRVPGDYFEVDNSRANTGQAIQRSLIIGQMRSGTALPNIPTISAGVGDAVAKFGEGSMLSDMVRRFRQEDYFGELWVLPLADNPGGTAMTGTITVVGTATGGGTLNVYVCGQLIQCAVASGDSAATIASSLYAQAILNPTIPATFGSPSGAVITVTANHKGATEGAGDIDMRANYLGSAGGEVFPLGVTVNFAVTSAGTGNPSLTAALANLGATTYDFIITPYTDPASVTALSQLMSDVNGRWSYLSELFGHVFNAYRGTFSDQTTYGLGVNNQHMSTIGFFDSPDPVWIWAASFGAICGASLRADPALPLQTLAMSVKAPPAASRFPLGERNTLYFDGISSFVVGDDGVVRLERGVTNYQTNAAGAPDDSYLDIETMATLQYLIRDLRIDLQSKYARKKLVDDGRRIPFGSNFVTAQTVLGECIANYTKNSLAGYCQNVPQFIQQASAENAGRGVVKVQLPFQLANQLRIIAALVDFMKP